MSTEAKDKAIEINNEKDFLNYIIENHKGTFQTKAISEYLKSEMNIPKIKTKIWTSILKTNGLIERKSESGYCKTTCASCYEYGCDAGQQSPINYWQVKTKSN